MISRRMLNLLRRVNHGLTTLKSSTIPKQWKPFDEQDVKNHVANIFSCPQHDADSLVDSIKESFIKDRSGRIEILRALHKRGLNIKNVASCKTIIKKPYETVKERIALLPLVFKDDSPETLIYVLRLSDEEATLIKDCIENDSDRLDILADMLKCSKTEICHLLIKYRFLIRIPIASFKNKLSLLLDNAFILEDIKTDLWVLSYTEDRLKDRLKELKKLDLLPAKTWMLRCLQRVLLRTHLNRKQHQDALGPFPNLTAFLANRLSMSDEQVEAIGRKHPPALRVQAPKLREIIDFLLSEGYTPEKIVQTPRVLCHSVATIQARLNELKRRNYVPATLSTLCKSSRDFQEFLDKVDRLDETVPQLKSD